MKLVALALYLMLSVFCVSALDQKQQEDPSSTASFVNHAIADQHKDETYLQHDEDNEEELYDEGDEGEELYDDEDADAVADHQTQEQRELGGWYGGGYGYYGRYHGGYHSYGRNYVHHRPVVYHHYRPRVVRRYYNNYYRYSGKGKGGMGMMGSWS